MEISQVAIIIGVFVVPAILLLFNNRVNSERTRSMLLRK